MNSILQKVWDEVVGDLDWLKQVIFGEFDDSRTMSAIIADMLVSFVPGVIIVTSARDLTAVTIRLVRHPEKRDDTHEWMILIACVIPLVLPILAAAVGAAAVGVGAVVGGIAGSEAGAALRAVCLMLIEKGGYMLAEVIGFLRKFVKGDIMAVLKDIKFAKYGKAIVKYVGDFITGLRSIILKLIEKLRTYHWVSGIEGVIEKLVKLEREFYAVQNKAISAIPHALAELDARLNELLAQMLPKDEHLAYAGVPAGHVEPVKPEKVKVAAMQGHGLGTPEGVKPSAQMHANVAEQANLHPQAHVEPKVGEPDKIPEKPTAYSVGFETKLDPSDFGKSRTVHFNRANAALDNALQSDAEFSRMMDDLVPGVQSSVSSVGGRATPTGWTWEHASSSTAFGEQGVMRLVPTSQHTPGSPWWRVLHPDEGASGGYSEWAIPAGAPKN